MSPRRGDVLISNNLWQDGIDYSLKFENSILVQLRTAMPSEDEMPDEEN